MIGRFFDVSTGLFISRPLAILVGMSVVVGCAAGGVRDTTTQSGASGSAVASPLAVTVENSSSLAAINSLTVTAPILSSDSRAGGLDAQRINTLVVDTAERELDLKVFDTTWLLRIVPKIQGMPTEPQRSTLKGNGADGTLVTEILEFKERSGSSVGGEPAAVAFRLSIIDNSTGKTAWQGTFSQRQVALTDNLLKLSDRFGRDGSGPGWSTAISAFERGLVDAFQDFRGRREKLFLIGGR